MKLISVLVLLVPSLCSARLGETLAKSVERYGEPTATVTNAANEFAPCEKICMFEKVGFQVLVGFWKSISVTESFRKKVSGDTEPQGVSLAEAQQLLKANAEGSEWL